MRSIFSAVFFLFLLFIPSPAQAQTDGWRSAWPRTEIKPEFSHAEGRLSIHAGENGAGQHGWWEKTFSVVGGKFYKFHALRKFEQVNINETDSAVARRSAIVRILWHDDNGKPVRADGPEGTKGYVPTAEPEYPRDGDTVAKKWIVVGGTYRAPSKATKAVVELHLRWARFGQVAWSDAALTETAPPPARKVRLAAVHFVPKGGKTPMDNCKMYEPHIAEAAKQKADLVVLGETITYVGLGKTFVDVAEKLPGASTEYFCALAKKYNIHIVVGLVERDGSRIYNVSVLIGPDGTIIGIYRKVCLPRGEVDAGLTPGKDYPVFATRFGKVGMMVCYDGFFPEPARELAKNGAEVIAWPVWGCNPLLASARACENHVYLVSSTYTDVSSNWTLTAVYDHDGMPLVRGEKWGTVIVAEVDLSRRYFWRNNLGDFQAEMHRSRPIAVRER